MKNFGTIALVAAALSFSACNSGTKSTTNETPGEHLDHTLETVDSTTAAIHNHTHEQITDAEAKVNKAKADLESAVASGDKKAQEAAQKVLNDANLAWDKTKDAAGHTAHKVESGVKNAAEKTEGALEKAADKTGNAIDKAVEATGKAAEKTGDAIDKKVDQLKKKMN